MQIIQCYMKVSDSKSSKRYVCDLTYPPIISHMSTRLASLFMRYTFCNPMGAPGAGLTTVRPWPCSSSDFAANNFISKMTITKPARSPLDNMLIKKQSFLYTTQYMDRGDIAVLHKTQTYQIFLPICNPGILGHSLLGPKDGYWMSRLSMHIQSIFQDVFVSDQTSKDYHPIRYSALNMCNLS